MKSLLFIGGTGFLGQSFFDYINEGKLKKLKLSHIIIVSRKIKKIKSNIKVSYIKKNIKNIKKIPITDFIIYAANSKDNNENLKGFSNFKRLLNENFKKTKILFTSSGAVYGPRKTKKKTNELDIISVNKINKFTDYKKEYAKTKIILEQGFKKLAKKGFKVSIARLFSFIGKRILINKSFAITNLINQAIQKNKYLKLNDSKKVFRSYMFSDDLIKWLIQILINSSSKCEVYNVGSDELITIEKLAKLIGQKFNKSVIKKEKNKKSDHIDFYVPLTSKAKKKLNLKINVDIKNSINMLLKNYHK